MTIGVEPVQMSDYGEGTAGGQGGGIYNTGTLLVSDCIVRDNVTGDGGFGGGNGGDWWRNLQSRPSQLWITLP